MSLYWDLFLSFFQIGLFSIGGGYAAMPLIQDQVVHKHAWLSMAEFADLVTISEMTPGPIALNAASFVGLRMAGFPGAVLASFANVLPSFIIASILAYVYYRFKKLNAVQGAIDGLKPTVVALIASAGLGVAKTAVETEQALLNGLLILLAFLALRKWRLNPIAVIFMSGILGLVLEFVF